jgi:N-acetylmuramoyl-L-alanine amidase
MFPPDSRVRALFGSRRAALLATPGKTPLLFKPWEGVEAVHKCMTSVAGAVLGLVFAEPVPVVSQTAALAPSFPIVTDARLAGDAKQTRFILDLEKTLQFRAFALDDPYRIVVDIPQVSFHLPVGTGGTGRGLVKAFRYGLVMPEGSRIVFDLTGPAKIANSHMLDSTNGQPPRLVLELEEVDRATFVQALTSAKPPVSMPVEKPASPPDARPVVVIDPGHGGFDPGAHARTGQLEKTLALEFALLLREQLEKTGKYRVQMTRSNDTFVPLTERVRFARASNASLFISIHCDSTALEKSEAEGATIYTISSRASDAEAEKLAQAENRVIAGVDLSNEPIDFADVLIDLAQRETLTFSNRFARKLVSALSGTVRLRESPLRSAGFVVLKAPDVPSVLIELGYLSNPNDLQNMLSQNWRLRTAEAIVQAVSVFLAPRLRAE